MDKNSTPTSTITPQKEKSSMAPSALTIAKIKQFARAYTFVPTRNTGLGAIIAN